MDLHAESGQGAEDLTEGCHVSGLTIIGSVIKDFIYIVLVFLVDNTR